ncbi:hypothetical protein HAX54_005384 [Datura stramonium]|uniref:Uncharacterized protein n=1 Tax=Datura stramonium TaxID=4076 RepID=A0ABS8T8M5_DATST|nr:hypothetical protein [Datura stramonium]
MTWNGKIISSGADQYIGEKVVEKEKETCADILTLVRQKPKKLSLDFENRTTHPTKPSIEEPPKLDLKPLSAYLNYKFLGTDDIILSSICEHKISLEEDSSPGNPNANNEAAVETNPSLSLCSSELQILSADPKTKAKTVTAQPTNDGQIDPADEAGAGAGASAATVAPMREQTVIVTAKTARTEEVDFDAAIYA